jgi:hypothetical protein
MKKVLLLLGLTLFSCGSNDDQDDDETTFLEKYDGFGYRGINETGDIEFWFFENNPTGVFLRYVLIEEDNGTMEGYSMCLSFTEGYNDIGGDSEDNFNFTIERNNSEGLVLRMTYPDDDDDTGLFEFNIDDSGDILRFINVDSETETFNRTQISYNSLCNN